MLVAAHVLRVQVSHHPPVSAFHVCHPGVGVDMSAAEQPRPHFNGLSVDVVREGAWTLTVDRWRETYHLNAPSLCMRLLPVPGVEWTGTVKITCAESSLEAKLEFHPRVMPGTQQHSVSGVIRCVPSSLHAGVVADSIRLGLQLSSNGRNAHAAWTLDRPRRCEGQANGRRARAICCAASERSERDCCCGHRPRAAAASAHA